MASQNTGGAYRTPVYIVEEKGQKRVSVFLYDDSREISFMNIATPVDNPGEFALQGLEAFNNSLMVENYDAYISPEPLQGWIEQMQ